ncbi:MAG: PIN domain-containing protein [Dehalococcoidia bacterium]
MIVDAGPIVAASDIRDPRRTDVQAALLSMNEPLVVSAFVAAEVDYMLQTRIGVTAARMFIQDLSHGRYQLETTTRAELSTVEALSDRYRDLAPGLADLSVVVLAHRFQTNRILTFDQRHFRTMAPVSGGAFELLPMDDMRDR